MRRGTSLLKLVWKHLMSLQTDFMEEETVFHFHPTEDFLASRSSGLRSIILKLLVRASNRFGVVRRVAIIVSVLLKKD